MKFFLSVAVVALALIGCTGSKETMLNKQPALVFDDPYWIQIVPGQPDGKKSIVLFLPYSMALENYAVDSAYFRGYHVPLKTSEMEGKKVYRARIMLEQDHVAVVPPYEIEENQALLTYVNREGVRRYFIVENIVQGESIFMP